MPFCPLCGYEYKEGVTSCADCGQGLVSELPQPPRISEEPLAVVYEAPDQPHSHMVKAALEEAGLPVIEQLERTAMLDDLDLSVVGRYSRLLTVESRAEEAKRITADLLVAYESGDLILPEEEADKERPKEATVKPHRGKTVLILGILGLALFPLVIGIAPALIAFCMGANDLKEMEKGTMDASGWRPTSIGQVCATLGGILGGIWAFVAFVLLCESLSAFL
ncbi:MAG: hypothetical protein GTN65_13400 [Armatimonadetes bacterium]|nr:hypothetical protein [Armatimonadota bacterium]NIO98055.1 hypothetical protein [Armatimonadota bacterium]